MLFQLKNLYRCVWLWGRAEHARGAKKQEQLSQGPALESRGFRSGYLAAGSRARRVLFSVRITAYGLPRAAAMTKFQDLQHISENCHHGLFKLVLK